MSKEELKEQAEIMADAIVGKFFKKLSGYIILTILVGWGLNYFRDTDSTDIDAYNRSGMAIHTDAKTGIQYLSTSGGGLTVRVVK